MNIAPSGFFAAAGNAGGHDHGAISTDLLCFFIDLLCFPERRHNASGRRSQRSVIANREGHNSRLSWATQVDLLASAGIGTWTRYAHGCEGGRASGLEFQRPIARLVGISSRHARSAAIQYESQKNGGSKHGYSAVRPIHVHLDCDDGFKIRAASTRHIKIER